MTTNPRDRRRAPRTAVMMAVGYEAAVDRGDAQTVDVSETGLFLGTENPLPVGTVLLVQVEESSLKVQVRRVVEGGAGQDPTPGMGVRIVEADDGARDVLRRYLREPERRMVSIRVDGPWAEAVPGPTGREAAQGADDEDDGGTDDESQSETDPADDPNARPTDPSPRGRRRRRRR